MSQSVVIRGVSYNLPTSGEVDWGSNVSTFLAAVGQAITTLSEQAGPAVIVWGMTIPPTLTSTLFFVPGHSAGTAAAVLIRVPSAGKVSNLHLRARVAVISGSETITVRKNGIATALTAAMVADLPSSLSSENTIDTFEVVAGDTLSVDCVSANAMDCLDLTATVLFTAD